MEAFRFKVPIEEINLNVELSTPLFEKNSLYIGSENVEFVRNADLAPQGSCGYCAGKSWESTAF